MGVNESSLRATAPQALANLRGPAATDEPQAQPPVTSSSAAVASAPAADCWAGVDTPCALLPSGKESAYSCLNGNIFL